MSLHLSIHIPNGFVYHTTTRSCQVSYIFSDQNGLGLLSQNVPNLAVKLYTTRLHVTLYYSMCFIVQSHITFHHFPTFYILQVIGHQA